MPQELPSHKDVALPKYRSHKIVEACVISAFGYPEEKSLQDMTEHSPVIIYPADIEIPPFTVPYRYILRHAPEPGGVFVRYEDGYISYSPYPQFDKGHIRMGGPFTTLVAVGVPHGWVEHSHRGPSQLNDDDYAKVRYKDGKEKIAKVRDIEWKVGLEDDCVDCWWRVNEITVESTPGTRWRERGEGDPHNAYLHGRERAQLVMGDLTDDELANELYVYDHRAGPHSMAYLEAAKDRIRWLSRALENAYRSKE